MDEQISTHQPIETPEPARQASNKILEVILAVVALGAVAGYLIWAKTHNSWPFARIVQQACTEEAKVCPDGSGVGRTGPNCEFAACPENNSMQGWQTYRSDNYGFEIKIPSDWHVELGNGNIYFFSPEFKRIADDIYKGCNDNDESTRCEEEMSPPSVGFSAEPESIDGTAELRIGELTWNRYQGYGIVYFLERGNQFYSFQAWEPEEILVTILSTFKFIESISEEESILKLLRDVVPWTDPGFGANFDAHIRECENGKMPDPALTIYTLNYEPGRFPSGAYDISEVRKRIPEIQEVLEANGWQKCSGADEPGFYYQTTYIKDAKLLGLNWGTRDAVIGGTYIRIQFEFE